MSFDTINVGGGQSADGATALSSPVRVGATYNSTPPSLTTGQAVSLQVTAAGSLHTTVDNGVTSGTAGAPSASVLTVQPIGGTSYSNTIITSGTPAAVTVKASAGEMLDLIVLNFNANPVFIHFFDTTIAPTLGTTNATFTLGVPGNSSGAGIAPPLKIPRSFVNAIRYAVTGGIAANDDTAIGTSGVIVDLTYL